MYLVISQIAFLWFVPPPVSSFTLLSFISLFRTLDTFDSAMNCHFLYFYMVTNYANPLALLTGPWWALLEYSITIWFLITPQEWCSTKYNSFQLDFNGAHFNSTFHRLTSLSRWIYKKSIRLAHLYLNFLANRQFLISSSGGTKFLVGWRLGLILRWQHVCPSNLPVWVMHYTLQLRFLNPYRQQSAVGIIYLLYGSWVNTMTSLLSPYLSFFPVGFGITHRHGCDSSNVWPSFHAHLGFAFSFWILYVFLRRIDERTQLIMSL